MKEKVIFDTNVITNRDTKNFFGGREMLMRFTQDADIVIPEIVIQEIKMQKQKKLSSNKDGFLSNPFHKLFGLNESDTKSFNIDNYLEKLLDEETIPFKRIDLKDNNVLTKIQELAIQGHPPFEEKEGNDKGIKDALIYFSILEYLQEIPNKYVFVCVKDERFKLALQQHHNIIVIETYEQFKQKSVSQFFDDYFIEKINTELDITITKDNIIEYWHNIDDNQNVLLKIDEEGYILEVDSGEIIATSKTSQFDSIITQLINSDNFGTTHNSIEQLSSLINFFSDDEILLILNASFVNEQIKWIVEDEDVKEFIGSLYQPKKELVSNDVADFLKEIFD
jgi:hypothetical protein